MSRRRAFTLIELLVAMGIFVMLGTSLVLILRGGLATWRRSEARQETYASAQALFAQLGEDLRSIMAPHDTPLEGLGDVEARLLCDLDEAGRQRLFLVRTIKAESEHPITGLAGTTIGADRVIDYRGDLEEARQARLRATGGAMEVAWVLGPGGLLYRGVKAPPGPPGSLFSNEDPYELAPLTPILPPTSEASPAATPVRPAAGVDPADLPALLRPFATNVIHLELRFWTQYSTSWDPKAPPRRRLSPGEESGALLYWDSTRAVLRAEDERDRRRFDTFKAPGSLADPRDDVFPAKVRVEVTFREAPAAGSSTFLTRALGAQDTELHVQEPGRLPPKGHLLVDDEWIEYEEVAGDRVVVAKDGRGARGTVAADHDAAEVIVGRTFMTIVDLPAWREDWGDRE